MRYADYYENAFINTILASQNPETGTTTYFNPMASGYHRVYNLPFTEFWCCTGTGMESFSKLGDSIYFTGQGSVWVNMFFSSTVEHAEQNLRLTQEANLPNEDTVTFRVDALDGGAVAEDATLRLRVPSWIAGEPAVEVNGATVEPHVSRGYVVLPVVAGDVVRYTMPMAASVVDTPDNPYFVAFRYGPVVLSANLGEVPSRRGRARASSSAPPRATPTPRRRSRRRTWAPTSGRSGSRRTSSASRTTPRAGSSCACGTPPTAATSSSRPTTPTGT